MDITRLIQSKRWAGQLAWPGYLLATVLFLFGFVYPPLFFIIGGLFITSYMMVRGYPGGALLQAAIVAILFVVANESMRSDPFIGPVTWVSALLIVLAADVLGFVAAVRYRRLLPAEASNRSPSGPAAWLSRRISAVRIRKLLAAAPYLALAFLCLVPLLALGSILLFELDLVTSFAPESDLVFWGSLGVFICLSIISVVAAYYFWTRAKRAASLSVAEAREQDPRPPFLLLRSFVDDLTPIGRKLPFTVWQPSDLYAGAWTLEEAVEKVLRRYGPVISIGRPGEKIPPAGAARTYVANDEWQDRVKQFISESQRVVVILGNTEGLEWEYRQLAELGAWDKLLLLFPPSKDELLERWGLFSHAAGVGDSEEEQGTISQALAATFSSTPEPRFVTCKWRNDEECYQLAIRAVLSDTNRTTSGSTRE
jgi:hypothetical protein